MSQYTTAPCDFAIPIAPSDTVDLAPSPALIYVGGAGNVSIQDTAGNVSLFTAPPVGSVLPVRARRVMATNTTATLLVACW